MFTSEFIDPALPLLEATARLLLSAVLAMAIGWERESHNKDAGIRTHMFVGLGSCAFMLVALSLTLAPPGGEDVVKIDPSRVIQGLIGGIGFLGAGVIIHGGGKEVRGLTTGAGIWLVGAVGLSCGVGAYALACTITVLAMIIVWGCRHIFKPIINQDDP